MLEEYVLKVLLLMSIEFIRSVFMVSMSQLVQRKEKEKNKDKNKDKIRLNIHNSNSNNNSNNNNNNNRPWKCYTLKCKLCISYLRCEIFHLKERLRTPLIHPLAGNYFWWWTPLSGRSSSRSRRRCWSSKIRKSWVFIWIEAIIMMCVSTLIVIALSCRINL